MANPNPSPATRIKPGERRNPEGKTGPQLKSILNNMANDLILTAKGKNLTRAQAICDVAWTLAMGGDMRAIEFIFDRIEGKVTDKVQLSGGNGGPLQIEIQYINDWRALGGEPSDN